MINIAPYNKSFELVSNLKAIDQKYFNRQKNTAFEKGSNSESTINKKSLLRLSFPEQN